MPQRCLRRVRVLGTRLEGGPALIRSANAHLTLPAIYIWPAHALPLPPIAVIVVAAVATPWARASAPSGTSIGNAPISLRIGRTGQASITIEAAIPAIESAITAIKSAVTIKATAIAVEPAIAGEAAILPRIELRAIKATAVPRASVESSRQMIPHDQCKGAPPRRFNTTRQICQCQRREDSKGRELL
jgi:hypothetical protein